MINYKIIGSLINNKINYKIIGSLINNKLNYLNSDNSDNSGNI